MPSRPFLAVLLCGLTLLAAAAEPLPDTKPLTDEGDLAAKMVEGIGKYLVRETAASVEKRKQYWKPDFSSPEAYPKSVQPNRERLKKILGVVDERVPFTDLEYVGGPKTPSLVAETDDYKVYAVRWPVLPGVDGEGLLLEPKSRGCRRRGGDSRRRLDAGDAGRPGAGRAEGRRSSPRRLAENGCRVLVPVAHRPQGHLVGQPRPGPHDQPAAPRIHLPHGLRDGPAHHRLRSAEGAGGGGLVLPGEGSSDADRRRRLRRRRTAGPVRRRPGPAHPDAGVVAATFGRARNRCGASQSYRNVFGLLREFGDAELAQSVRWSGDSTLRRHGVICSSANGQRPAVSGPPAACKPGAPGPRRAVEQPRTGRPWKPNTRRIDSLGQRPGYSGPYFASLKLGEQLALIPTFVLGRFRRRPGWRRDDQGRPRRPPTSARISTPPSANTASSINSSPSRKSCCATPSAAASVVLVQAGHVLRGQIRGVLRSRSANSSTKTSSASCPIPTAPMNPRTRLLYDEPK